jgi:hypothetical protein
MSNGKFVICVRHAGSVFVVHPANEEAHGSSKATSEKEVWYYSTTKTITEFTSAGVFGSYDSLAAAEAAVTAVDPGAQQIYKPPTPPDA